MLQNNRVFDIITVNKFFKSAFMKNILLLMALMAGVVCADDTNSTTQYQAMITDAANMAQDPNYQAQQREFTNRAAQIASASVANTFISVPYAPKNDNISKILQTQTNTKIVFSNRVTNKPIIYDIINQKAQIASTNVINTSPYTIVIERKSDQILIDINNSTIGVTLNNKVGGIVVNNRAPQIN